MTKYDEMLIKIQEGEIVTLKKVQKFCEDNFIEDDRTWIYNFIRGQYAELVMETDKNCEGV